MTKWMETICGQTCGALVEEILSEDGEYLVRTHNMENKLKRLMRSLDESIALRVDDLLVEQMAIGELRESAYFIISK